MRPELAVVLLTLMSCKGQYYESQIGPPDFTYTGAGLVPAIWAQKYETCGGQKQSPIEINAAMANKTDFPQLMWTDYLDTPRTYVLLNNWQGVQMMTAPGSMEAKLKGGPLTSEYVLSHIAFKWGNDLGSEHAIDKYYYGLEAQLVHYKKTTANLEMAMKDPEGFAIVSVLFMIDQKNNNKDLDTIAHNLKNSAAGGAFQNITGSNPIMWMKKYISSDCNCTKEAYYTYLGSLTTPPCTENVIWIVMAKPLMIGQLQLKEFSKIRGVSDANIAENKRPTQQINNRRLQYRADATGVVLNWLLLLFGMIVCQHNNA